MFEFIIEINNRDPLTTNPVIFPFTCNIVLVLIVFCSLILSGYVFSLFEISIQYTKPFDAKGLPIHYHEPNKYNLIFNILVDIYYLYKCEHFIPSDDSLVSKFVIIMRTEKRDIFY